MVVRQDREAVVGEKWCNDDDSPHEVSGDDWLKILIEYFFHYRLQIRYSRINK